jgi:hypothetical protein
MQVVLDINELQLRQLAISDVSVEEGRLEVKLLALPKTDKNIVAIAPITVATGWSKTTQNAVQDLLTAIKEELEDRFTKEDIDK